MDLHILLPAWGSYFRKLTQNYVLPSHLSANNLPAIAKDVAVSYRIYSTQTDYQAIVREAPGLIKRLADFAKIDWVPLPDEVSFTREPGSDKTDQTKNIRAMDRYDMSKFNLQSACYFDGIRAGAAADAALVIATADVVYADGTFPAIVELLESGARGICFAPFDMVHEPAAHRIAEKFARPEEFSITVPPRDLVRLALDCLHPSVAGAFVDSEWFPQWKHNLLWHVGDGGLVQRWFAMHPLAIRPTRHAEPQANDQIDGGFIFTVIPELERIHVVGDSDAICAGCLAPADYYYGRPESENRFSTATLAEVLRELKRKLFRHYPEIDFFARHKVLFHADPVTPAWQPVINESERVIAAVMDAYAQTT